MECAVSEIRPSWIPPELAKSGIAGAWANQAFSCQISLLPEGEHVWSWFQATETTRQAAGITEPEEVKTLLGQCGGMG